MLFEFDFIKYNGKIIIVELLIQDESLKSFSLTGVY